MGFCRLEIKGLALFEPRVFEDERGLFFESFNAARFAEATAETAQFVQDNQSVSHKGVLRGLHYQLAPHGQGKLVRVVAGAAFDVAVDIRPGSLSFGKWYGTELSAANRRQLWVPAGFAHGFLALEPDTAFVYKVTAPWHAASERTIRWDDPAIGIDWPLEGAPILSARDAAAPSLAEAEIS